MSKVLIALLALTSCALAQTYRTVTADTNNVIRTNFTIGSGQVSGLSNIITNIPATNITGVLSLSQGGVGATSAATALVNLLPSYTGNSNAVLALNSNATTVIWSTNAGGSGVGINTRVSTNGGVNLATIVNTTNFATNNVGGGFAAGNGAYAGVSSVAIGESADGNDGGAAIGELATVWEGTNTGNAGGGSIGARTFTYSGFAGGYRSYSTYGAAAGDYATTTTGAAIGDAADSTGGGAVGSGTIATDGGAIGLNAKATDGFAGGKNSRANSTSNVQLGTGTNSANNTIQFLSAGSVDTNEWAALANAGSVGTNLLQSAAITDAQAAMFTATTTNSPTNTNAPTPNAWLDIRVGTNDYKLPLWQ